MNRNINHKGLLRNVVTLVSFCVLGSDVFAHANLDFANGMKPRRNSASIKTTDLQMLPCGPEPLDKPTTDPAKRTALVAGQKYVVKWVESIDHVSKYRLGFSADKTDNFSVALMDLNQFDNDAVTPDQIATADLQDKAGGAYSFEITVPSTPCDECAIQLLQKMFNGATLSTTTYTSCMDIRIVATVDDLPKAVAKPTGLTIKVVTP